MIVVAVLSHDVYHFPHLYFYLHVTVTVIVISRNQVHYYNVTFCCNDILLFCLQT